MNFDVVYTGVSTNIGVSCVAEIKMRNAISLIILTERKNVTRSDWKGECVLESGLCLVFVYPVQNLQFWGVKESSHLL